MKRRQADKEEMRGTVWVYCCAKWAEDDMAAKQHLGALNKYAICSKK